MTDKAFDFQASKFGMFIHWGLYSAIGLGEWHMHHVRMPVAEYEKLANSFNPVKFNARDWVGLAKAAGMKYIVITAKHHDGFAMFDSKADLYNITSKTPFKRDPLAELRQECDKQAVQLCFYYSHVIDWHHPHALHESANNDWDYDISAKDFYTYWNTKAKPQVRELLENYGPIGLLWFDTAGDLSEKDSQEMYDLVKSIQPTCLVNSRLSHVPDMGDYSEKGDNEIPMLGDDRRAWQTPMTLNQSWGFEKREQNWKEPRLLIYKLVNIISKGGNFLLNIGPTAEGQIPEESVLRLKELGKWIKGREESIYNTTRTPFPYEHYWGGITARENMLYLHIFNERLAGRSIFLPGLKNTVKTAFILKSEKQNENASPEREYLIYKEGETPELSLKTLEIILPDILPSEYVTTVALEFDGKPETDVRIIQQQIGVSLDMPAARLCRKTEIIPESTDVESRIAEWEFLMLEPGEYSVHLVNFKKFNTAWDYPVASIIFEGKEFTRKPLEDYTEKDSPSCQHPYHLVRSFMCNIRIEKPGMYKIALNGHLVGKIKQGFEAWQAPEYRLRSLFLCKDYKVNDGVIC